MGHSTFSTRQEIGHFIATKVEEFTWLILSTSLFLINIAVDRNKSRTELLKPFRKHYI